MLQDNCANWAFRTNDCKQCAFWRVIISVPKYKQSKIVEACKLHMMYIKALSTLCVEEILTIICRTNLIFCFRYLINLINMFSLFKCLYQMIFKFCPPHNLNHSNLHYIHKFHVSTNFILILIIRSHKYKIQNADNLKASHIASGVFYDLYILSERCTSTVTFCMIPSALL